MSTGTELLTGTTLRKIRAGTNITVATVDGDISIAASSSGGVSQTQVDNSITSALTSYTLSRDINSAVAHKNDLLASAGGTGNAILSSNIIKRLDFDGDFTITDANNKIAVSLSTPLS